MIGDVLLSASPTLFLIGLVIFLLAHIAYSLAFISDTKILRIYSGIPFLIYGIAIYAYLFPALNNMVIAVEIYIIVICTMMWRSAARIHQGMSVVSSEWIGFAGAVLFALSDTILAVDRFNLDVPNEAYIIFVIYWLGQLGITYSAKYR